MRCKSWAFLLYNGCEMAGMCLICALLLEKCLAVCLTLCLASDARRRGRGGSDCEICGRSGCGCCACWAMSAGGFPITRTGAACTGLPAGAWAVWSWVWWLLFPEGPAAGFQRGPLFGVALTGRVAVVVLVVLSLPDLWMISPAECGCSGQSGRRFGCVLLGMNAAGVGCCLCCHAGRGTM